MKRSTLWLITAAVLILLGAMIFGGVMTVLSWDFSKLSTAQYETNRHEIGEKFSNISVETDTTDLTFALSEDGICRVECYEESKGKHTVAVQDDTLTIKLVNEKAWYDYIGIHFAAPKIKVYLPEKEYASLCVRNSTGKVEMGEAFKFENVDISLTTGGVDFHSSVSETLKIGTSTGAIFVSDISAGAVDLSASTGEIAISSVTCHGDTNIALSTGKTRLKDVTCKNLSSKANTGDVTMENVVVTEKLYLERSTGDVKFNGCDAAEIFIKTDTGDVNGTLLSDKIFVAQTDTGRVNVPRTVTGGRCEISTDTGDIQITVQ